MKLFRETLGYDYLGNWTTATPLRVNDDAVRLAVISKLDEQVFAPMESSATRVKRSASGA